jgi:hypothetical protein
VTAVVVQDDSDISAGVHIDPKLPVAVQYSAYQLYGYYRGLGDLPFGQPCKPTTYVITCG